MPSVQRFLSGHNNLARTAVLSASSVRPSTAIERVAARRAGGGRVRLAGAYVGHEAAQVDVEIVAAGGIPRASVPQFVGVGNGQLVVEAVDAAAPLQELTLTLVDLGVATEYARLDAREVQIRARASGATGNSIRITVQPLLMRTLTAWALLADWSAGTAVQTGTQWDFGGLPLTAQGELDPASPRIQFGFDPQVYRPWRQFKDGAWQFGLSPQLDRGQSKGTAVYSVTGGYLVSVTDGVATETYGDVGAGQSAIVTFYDLLTALQASALVEVAGIVAADRTASGQAAIDVPIRTQAWLMALGGKVQLQDVTVPPAAPTQTLTVRCINADVVGRERWSVAGDVSGALAVATTGEPYDSTAARFLVPAIDPATVGTGEWGFKYEPIPRDVGVGVPSVCVRPFRFGRNAKVRTVTFRYQRRPPPDCKCSDMPTPKVSLKCLGLEGDAMALEPAYHTRLQDLFEWRSDFAESNVAVGPAPGFSKSDLDFCDRVTDAFVLCLGEAYESAPALAEWDGAFTEMKAGMLQLQGLSASLGAPRTVAQSELAKVWVNPANGKAYMCLDAGISPPIQPCGNGWVDPADVAWVTTGAPFSVDHVVSAPDGSPATTYPVLYRCIGDEKDLPTDSEANTTARAQLLRRFTARMDYVRTIAGIVPKSESSSGDAGGCWIDHGTPYWWVDVDGYYLPAFSNEAYISARRNTETGEAYSTMEFGFGLVVACPERLKEGDTLTIRINQVDGERPYQVGDEAVIQTIAAGPAWLAGGVDGTDVQTWRVAGSLSGALADYMVPTDGSPVPGYNGPGADLRIAPGGIPFVLGDAFSLAIEAGQYRWRRDGGAWSATADIPTSGEDVLEDGLTVHFDPGAAPSFVPSDAYAFAVHQPWAVGHVRDAQATAWAWAGDGASIVVDLGSVQSLGAIALARYELSAGAVVTVEASDDAAAWAAPVVLDVSRAVCVRFVELQARYLRLTTANAAGGSIGWIWAGQPLTMAHHASRCQRRRRWSVGRGSGVNPSSLFAGAGDGWSLGWSLGDEVGSRLVEADVLALMGLLNWAQEFDEPMLFAPHHAHPQDASLVRFAADALDVSDIHEYQPNDAGHRVLSVALELEPVFA